MVCAAHRHGIEANRTNCESIDARYQEYLKERRRRREEDRRQGRRTDSLSSDDEDDDDEPRRAIEGSTESKSDPKSSSQPVVDAGKA